GPLHRAHVVMVGVQLRNLSEHLDRDRQFVGVDAVEGFCGVGHRRILSTSRTKQRIHAPCDHPLVGFRDALADTTPLRNPHFRRLWTANIITVVGAQLTVVAVPAQIYAETGSSAYVGLTGLFGLVPLIVFGLWGGALADVMDRRTLLVITTVGLIGTSAGFWLQAALGAGNVWLLLGLFAVQQAFFAVNQPTRSAILPKLLPAAELPAANSLNMTVMQAGGIAGPLVG